MEQYQHLCACGALIPYGREQAGQAIHCPACGATCRPPALAPRPVAPVVPVPVAETPPPPHPVRRGKGPPGAASRSGSRGLIWIVSTAALAILSVALFTWARSASGESVRLQSQLNSLQVHASALDRERQQARDDVASREDRIHELETQLDETGRARDAATAEVKNTLERLDRAQKDTAEQRVKREVAEMKLGAARKEIDKLEERVREAETKLKPKAAPPASVAEAGFLVPSDYQGEGLARVLRAGGYECDVLPSGHGAVAVHARLFTIVARLHDDSGILFTALFRAKQGTKAQILEELNALNSALTLTLYLAEDTLVMEGYFPLHEATRGGLLRYLQRVEAMFGIAAIKLVDHLR